MTVLFIVPYCSMGASNRYRVEQYLPYLKSNGIEYRLRPFVFEEFYKILYLKRKYLMKIIYFIKAFLNRILDISRLYKYDLVFIHREACPFGPPIFEYIVYFFKKPLIFDFDDAIYLQNFNPANRMYSFLKFPSKTKSIIRISSCVIVANKFLKEYACRHNKNVYIIPTPIDTERFKPTAKPSNRITIGWIGSPTTAPYLKIILPVMRILRQKYDFCLKIVGSGENSFVKDIKVENIAWQLNREIEDFQSIDIGIYPMPDTLWACGKAGFKAIQYMAVGVPVVASPVGMVKDIIQDGVNGFLADSAEDWTRKLSRLIGDSQLRQNIGLNGRKSVEEKYSVIINAQKFIDRIKNV